MISALTWLDHDPAERERTNSVLKLFEEQGTVDELGVGNIRDSIADQLFPGTSTIQTRLRYFLLVPWIYRQLEDRRVTPERFESESRKLQDQVRAALEAAGETEGVIGRSSGIDLIRTPDHIYWNGLVEWGIRRYSGSIGSYIRDLPLIYRMRDGHAQADEVEAAIDRRSLTWHPELPAPPHDWLEQTVFALSREEAEFLQDCIRLAQPGTLLAFMADGPVTGNFATAWEHADLAMFPDRAKKLLEHARIFSLVHHGAAILYNVLLARKRNWKEMIDRHEESFHAWEREIDRSEIRDWSLSDFWFLVRGGRYRITRLAQEFVEHWVGLVTAEASLLNSSEAHNLIENRESLLKGVHAKLKNQRALESWGGASGLRRLTYRWEEAQRYVNELATGLSGR